MGVPPPRRCGSQPAPAARGLRLGWMSWTPPEMDLGSSFPIKRKRVGLCGNAGIGKSPVAMGKVKFQLRKFYGCGPVFFGRCFFPFWVPLENQPKGGPPKKHTHISCGGSCLGLDIWPESCTSSWPDSKNRLNRGSKCTNQALDMLRSHSKLSSVWERTKPSNSERASHTATIYRD